MKSYFQTPKKRGHPDDAVAYASATQRALQLYPLVLAKEKHCTLIISYNNFNMLNVGIFKQFPL